LLKEREHVSAPSPSAALRERGFTLVEVVVTVGVLVVLVLLATQLLKSASTVTTLGHRQMDADAQARQLLDRMNIDFAQLVKRNDLDFFGKNTVAPNSVGGAMDGTGGQTKNDRIAFYSAVPGYYPAAGAQSPVSLVAYRINSGGVSSVSNKMERMGKGLVWNGVDANSTPVAFMPITIAASWAAATSGSTLDPAYELVGPGVFRFEYCYLLTNGTVTITPPVDGNSHADLSQIAGIIVTIAVIDPKSKVLLNDAQITLLAAQLADCPSNINAQPPGYLRALWQSTLDANTTFPPAAISGIRLYERFFYLSPPVQ
jgi:prepilin-type N-terminal cleavage/methylation domain-containing protein